MKEYEDEENDRPKLKLALVAVLTICIIVGGFFGASALSDWLQNINWEISNESIAVSGSTTLDYGVVNVGDVFVEEYTVLNDGNVGLTMAASTSGTGFSAVWNATGATLAVGESAGFELTLTINGAGSCQVAFSIV